MDVEILLEDDSIIKDLDLKVQDTVISKQPDLGLWSISLTFINSKSNTGPRTFPVVLLTIHRCNMLLSHSASSTIFSMTERPGSILVCAL